MDCENSPPKRGLVNGGRKLKDLSGLLVCHYARARLIARPRVCVKMEVFAPNGRSAVVLYMHGYMNSQ